MKNYNNTYLKHEDLNWQWFQDHEKKVYKLCISHTPSKKSVTGEMPDLKNSRRPLDERKKELYDSLVLKLEDILFG